jgi:hypothetical protein
MDSEGDPFAAFLRDSYSWKHDEVRFRIAADKQPSRSVVAQGDLRSVDAKDAGTAARGALARDDLITGEKSKFHQAPGDVVGQLEPVDNTTLSGGKVGQRWGH